MFQAMEDTLAERVFDLIRKLNSSMVTFNPPVTAAPSPKVVAAQGGIVQEIGRNDACPCGSGKKWKNCGLLNTEEHQRLMAAQK